MEVDLHRKMYKLGQEKSVTPTVLFESLEFGIEAAICGISSAKKEGNQESKKAFTQDCENFLKTAKKILERFWEMTKWLNLWGVK